MPLPGGVNAQNGTVRMRLPAENPARGAKENGGATGTAVLFARPGIMQHTGRHAYFYAIITLTNQTLRNPTPTHLTRLNMALT